MIRDQLYFDYSILDTMLSIIVIVSKFPWGRMYILAVDRSIGCDYSSA